MNFEGTVRRTDLNFRGKYPNLATTIYQLTNTKFLISCSNVGEDFEKIKHDFHSSIRPLTLDIELAETAPSDFEQIIAPIMDNEIAKNFEGIFQSTTTILGLLKEKFPNVMFIGIEESSETVTIRTARFKVKSGSDISFKFLNYLDRDKIQTFLNGLKLPTQFLIKEEDLDTRESSENNEGDFSNPVRTSPLRSDTVSKFILRDEAIWYDNLDSIFQGTFKKTDLYFYDPDEYSCYVDYSNFGNIDIRNFLFLFQTIYLTLPYEKPIEVWLAESKITKREFLELVSRGRIKIALTQPDFRYDSNFLSEVYEVCENAVISRRAVSALQQIDIVEISDNYILNDINVINQLKPLCQALAEATNTNPSYIHDSLVWPIKARRQSFERLNYAGLIGIASFGVNTAIEQQISSLLKRDLTFDFTVNAPAIHLSNSLNATYFPFVTEAGYSDSYYATVMGDLLNFYKSANSKQFKSFSENKIRMNSGILPINPIDVIEVNSYIPITEFEEILSKDVIFPNSKRLIESLSELSDEDRQAKIKYYNDEVAKINNRRSKNKSVMDLGENVILDTAGAITGIGLIGSLLSITKMGKDQLFKQFPSLNKITDKLNEALNDNVDKDNIHYLTKINRVAKVKRN